MAQYWLKASPDAPADGPLTAAEVKRRAASGAIARDTLISMDNAVFHPAGRVKGLFAAPAAPANEEAVATAAAAPSRAPLQRGGLPPAYPGTQRRVVDSTMAQAAPLDSTPRPPAPAPTLPVAEHADGTIESQPPMPMPVPPPPPTPVAATPPPLNRQTQPRTEPPPRSLAYATPGVTGQGVIRPRRTGGFLVIAILMFIVGLTHAYTFYRVSFVRSPQGLHIAVMVASNLAWLALSIGAIVMWAMWIGGVHKDMQILRAGQYPVSPAKATGFLFIPLFNAFWVVYAPAKLAKALNWDLETTGQPKIASGAVAACQVVSVVAPVLGLYALTPLMYAISMRIIQRGFNRIAASQYTS